MVGDVVMSRFRIARGVSNRQSYLTEQRQVAGETRECQPFICMGMEGRGVPPILTYETEVTIWSTTR